MVGTVEREGEGGGRWILGRPVRFASLAICLGVTLAMCTRPPKREESSRQSRERRGADLHVGKERLSSPTVSWSLDVVLTIKGHGPRSVSMPRRIVDSRSVSLV